MIERRITYARRPDVKRDQDLDALASIYALLLRWHRETKKTPDVGGTDEFKREAPPRPAEARRSSGSKRSFPDAGTKNPGGAS
jgi:hypothetical protein